MNAGREIHGAKPSARFVARIAVLLAAIVSSAVAATPATALVGSVPDPIVQTNGSVTAFARGGDRVFVGGDFTRVGIPTGGGADLAQSNGAPNYAFAKPDDVVRAVVSDGAGGWYVGGSFLTVGSVSRHHLAHLLADGSVDPAFSPSVTGDDIEAMALSGTTLYVGGRFSAVDGLTRNGLAAIDLTTGHATSFDADLQSPPFTAVIALAVSGTRLYVSTSLQKIVGPTTYTYLFALDRGTAAAVPSFAPDVEGPPSSLAVSGGKLYVANGVPGRPVGALNESDGSLDAAFDVGTAGGAARVLAVSGSKLYVGGGFATVKNGIPHRGLAAFNLADGSLDAAFDATIANNQVFSLTVSGGTVFAGGDFTAVNGSVPRNRLAAFDASTGAVTSFDPNVDDAVGAIAAAGSRIYAGGFRFAGADTIHNRLVALRPDGTLDPGFEANVGTGNVVSLVASGSKLYAGGSFGMVNGSVVRNDLAAFDVATGAVDPAFDPNLDGSVETLGLAGGKVYAGGFFTTVNGGTVTRNRLAAFDAATGVVDPVFNPSLNGFVNDLLVSGGKVYVGGNFTSIATPAGTVARSRLAALDAVTAAPDPAFNAGTVSGAVGALALSGNRLYAGGAFTLVNGSVPRNRLAAFDAGTGVVDPTFDPNINFTVNALALSGTTVYAGGVFTAVNGTVARTRLAAFDRLSGIVEPSFDAGIDAENPVFFARVSALLATGSKLYVGGFFGAVAGSTRFKLARFSDPSVTLDPPVLTDTDPPSPSNQNAPKVKGMAPEDSTVKIYTDAACTGPVAATGTAAAFASPGLAVSVTDNTTTIFYATATSGPDVSACSSSSLTYVEDSTPPGQPTLSDTDPDSPSSDSAPKVKGTADASSTVKLYSDATCTGAVAATGPAGAFASPGLLVTVVADSTTTFHATATDAAGNTSACSSSSITYVEDSTPPDLVTLAGTDPASPANDNAPKVKGTAAAGSTVKLYTTAACSGAVAASGSAATFTSPGFAVSVADDSSTTFYATATDLAGNASGCSTSSVTYVEDSTPPGLVTLTGTDPASPANNNAPKVKGAAAAGSTVRLYTTASCSGTAVASGSAAQLASPGLAIAVPDDSATTLHARAIDAAGNESGCSSSSVTYVEVSTAPAPPPPPPIVPPPPPPLPLPVPDTAAPPATLAGQTTQKLAGTVRIIVSCPSEACRATAAGTVRVPKAGRTKAKTYTLAKVVKTIGAGGKATFQLKLSAAARSAIRRALRAHKAVTVTITVSAADAAGNARKLTRKVKLRL